MSRRRWIVPLALAAVVWTDPTWAASRTRPSLESIVLRSGFIGTVRCVTAGVNVARYEVLDSWKGPPAGTIITMRRWLPQGACWAAFVGEEFLIAVDAAPGPPAPLAPECTILPLDRRRIDVDFEARDGAPVLRLPIPPGRYALSSFGRESNDVERLRSDVVTLAARGEHSLELQMLRRKLVHSWALSEPVREAIGDTSTVEGVLGEVFAAAREADAEALSMMVYVSGGPRTRAFVESIPAERSPLGPTVHDRLLEGLRANWTSMESRFTGCNVLWPRMDPCPDLSPEQAVRILAGPACARSVTAAITVLCERDPEAVGRFLANVVARPSWPSDTPLLWATTFASHAVHHDPERLRPLLGSRDPLVCATAATYLAFLDEPTGVRWLHLCTALDGDAGAWAALNLARRGDRSAIRRAFEVFDVDRPTPFCLELRSRVQTLLSNSSAASGIEPPPLGANDDPTAWWNTHGASLTLADPWLPELIEQRVD